MEKIDGKNMNGNEVLFLRETKPGSCILLHRKHLAENYCTFNLFFILQEKCIIRQDEDKNFFVQCGSGEKQKTKNRKGPNSPGENKKRPSSQVS